jgi:hypothetical protein
MQDNAQLQTIVPLNIPTATEIIQEHQQTTKTLLPEITELILQPMLLLLKDLQPVITKPSELPLRHLATTMAHQQSGLIRRCVSFRVSFFVAKFGMFTHNLFSFQYYMLCLKRLMARYPFCCCKHTLLWSYNQNICSYLIFCFVLFSIIQNICRVNELCMDYKHFGCSLFII